MVILHTYKKYITNIIKYIISIIYTKIQIYKIERCFNKKTICNINIIYICNINIIYVCNINIIYIDLKYIYTLNIRIYGCICVLMKIYRYPWRQWQASLSATMPFTSSLQSLSPKSQELKIMKKNKNYINVILSSEHMQSIMGFKKIYDIGTCFRECTSLHYLFSWVDTCVYTPRAPSYALFPKHVLLERLLLIKWVWQCCIWPFMSSSQNLDASL